MDFLGGSGDFLLVLLGCAAFLAMSKDGLLCDVISLYYFFSLVLFSWICLSCSFWVGVGGFVFSSAMASVL